MGGRIGFVRGAAAFCASSVCVGQDQRRAHACDADGCSSYAVGAAGKLLHRELLGHRKALVRISRGRGIGKCIASVDNRITSCAAVICSCYAVGAAACDDINPLCNNTALAQSAEAGVEYCGGCSSDFR